MLAQSVQAPSVAGDLARALLCAWNECDANRLSLELNRVLLLPVGMAGDGEADRRRLLFAIAAEMVGGEDAPIQAEIDVWLSLLRSLAQSAG